MEQMPIMLMSTAFPKEMWARPGPGHQAQRPALFSQRPVVHQPANTCKSEAIWASARQ